ncbi:hypothetical protein FDI24_gp151 [Acidovorax phage ACP17]|uniref:Uncharacterized protein n=1 Tax=Acidovorax phage ACP17 TaxID=2010329 RepID=A0A218M306_9CAUD|nr:hypothetical protein FDI24_gp151 [Acidovorax phage ACP17]ASD50432.1 hypothetical protein [Acidovorax phage ACP17]
MGHMDDVTAMRSVIEELADFRRLPAVETCAFCGEGEARLLVIRHCSSCEADYSGSPEGRMQAQISCADQVCERCSGSGEDPEGYYDQSKGNAGGTHDGPCRNCSGSGEIKPT